LAEVYIALDEAAEHENISYEAMKKKIQRNPQAFKTKTETAVNGGKDRVLVALSSLSKKARRAHKEAQSIEGRDVVIGERITDGAPWYIDVDLNWYIENNGKQYYQAVELAKTIQEFLNYADENRTEFAQEFAANNKISRRTLYRYTESYLEASAWAMKLSKEDGKNYDFFKVLALCRKPKQRFTFPSLTDRVKAFVENLWFDKEFAANNGTIDMLYEKLEETGDQHTACQERENLLHESPGGLYPGYPLLFLKPSLQHECQDNQKGCRDIPFGGEYHRPDGRLPRGGFGKSGEDEDQHHCEHEKSVLSEGPVLFLCVRQVHFSCGPLRVIFSEKEGHQQPSEYGEQNSADRPGKTKFPTQDSCCENDGKHVDGRAGIEKGCGRPYACATHVDAGKEREHSAGANGQDSAGDGRDGVGENPVRSCTEVFQHRGL